MALNVSARIFRFGINLYPPYLGAGIRCHRMDDDWREAHVSMRLAWYNRNFVGTHFGGSLYSMTDAFYAVMLLNVLERKIIVWDQKGQIEYLKPGRKRVHARFVIDDAMVRRIHEGTADGQKYLEDVVTDIADDDDEIVARVTRTLYLREKRSTDVS